jgi:hypothetical protein
MIVIFKYYVIYCNAIAFCSDRNNDERSMMLVRTRSDSV